MKTEEELVKAVENILNGGTFEDTFIKFCVGTDWYNTNPVYRTVNILYNFNQL